MKKKIYLSYDQDRRLLLHFFRKVIVLKTKAKSKPFIYNGKLIDLFEHEYNCYYKNVRMTERAVELALTKEWLKDKTEVIEVGAVTSYYWPNLIKDIVDPADNHPLVNYKCSLFDKDFTDRNVLSISTIEHVGTFEHDLQLVEDCVEALIKLIKESKNCLITFPVGYNKKLDEYIKSGQYKDMELKNNEKLEVTVFDRGIIDNIFKQVPFEKWPKLKYSRYTGARAVAIIDKKTI